MSNPRISSFVKKGKAKSVQIPGTKVAIQNSQLLISSGIPTFDSNIGGGLPVGSLILIDEDTHSAFSKLFLKYFLAEGLVSNQAIHVCSKDVQPESFVNELPGPVETDTGDGDSKVEDEKMTIAWRYQNMKLVSSENVSSQHFGHHFDLTKKMDVDFVKKSDFSHWWYSGCLGNDSFEKTDFGLLLQSIREKLETGKYLISDSPAERKILRLGLIQIGSPLWPSSLEHLPVFLYCLRALLRNSFSTCMISVPFHLFQNASLKEKCVHLSDICIQLESFSGTSLEQNKALRDYNGFFRILKWAAINGLVTGGSQSVDLALKLRRRKLVIEKLHLPPELEDTTQREGDASSEIGCGSAKSQLLEF